MSPLTYRGLLFVLVTGGLTLAGACAANAAETDGTNSIGGGNQVQPSISAPVTIEGNSLAVLGDASSADTRSPAPGASAEGDRADETDGSGSILGGNQLAPILTAPVTAEGNAVALLGDATAKGAAPATAPAGSAGSDRHRLQTNGMNSIGGGNQLAPEVTAPISAHGNAIALLGDATAGGTAPARTGGGSVSGSQTDGSGSIAGGNQIVPAVRVPVTVSGNSVSLLGDRRTEGLPTHPASTLWLALAALTPEHPLPRLAPHLRLAPPSGGAALPLLGGVGVTVGSHIVDKPSVEHPAPGTETPQGGAPTSGTTDGSTAPGTQPVLPALAGAGGRHADGGATAGAVCLEVSLLHRAEPRDGSAASGPGLGVSANETCAASLDLAGVTATSPARLDGITAGVLSLAGALALVAAATTLRTRTS